MFICACSSTTNGNWLNYLFVKRKIQKKRASNFIIECIRVFDDQKKNQLTKFMQSVLTRQNAKKSLKQFSINGKIKSYAHFCFENNSVNFGVSNGNVFVSDTNSINDKNRLNESSKWPAEAKFNIWKSDVSVSSNILNKLIVCRIQKEVKIRLLLSSSLCVWVSACMCLERFID